MGINNNTFDNSKPNFGFSHLFGGMRRKSKHSGYAISDDIEDVQFEDVTGQENTEAKEKMKHAFNEMARAKQVYEAAEDEFKCLKEYSVSPLRQVMYITLFTMGADWADHNPESDFPSGKERLKAMYNKIKEICESGDEPAKPSVALVVMLTFTLGAKWADVNPPEYKGGAK